MKPKYDRWLNHDTNQWEVVVGDCRTDRPDGMSHAHWLPWVRARLPKREGDWVLHKCGNGHEKCSNEDHLYLGTPSENIKDRHRQCCLPGQIESVTNTPKIIGLAINPRLLSRVDEDAKAHRWSRSMMVRYIVEKHYEEIDREKAK